MTLGAWLAIVAGAFVAGLVVGLSWNAPAPGATPERQAAGRVDPTATVLHDGDERDAFKLRQQLDIMRRNQASAALADRLAFFEKYKDAMGLQSIDESLRVNPEMMDFIQMTDSERKQVEAHLKQAADQIKALEKANVQVVKQDASGVSYRIAAFPEGKEVKTDLEQQLREDLGARRAEVLIDTGGYGWRSACDGFGDAPLQVDITRLTPSDANGPPYQLHETFENGSMTGGMYNLPPRYQGVLELPP